MESSIGNCVGTIEKQLNIDGKATQVRFHLVHLDGNGRFLIDSLTAMLATHIVPYCLDQTSTEMIKMTALVNKAKKLFRKPHPSQGSDKTGEAGELLLYCLIEEFLQAPQVVCKMSLKTNQNDEVKGSDGIHAKQSQEDGMIDFYFGESKIHKTFSSGIRDMVTSLNKIEKQLKHELFIVTEHYNKIDKNIQTMVEKSISNQNFNRYGRVNYACLVGYNSSSIIKSIQQKENNNKLVYRFETEELETILEKLKANISKITATYHKLEFFIMPFECVEQFRTSFKSEI